jgi:hypothetical protein
VTATVLTNTIITAHAHYKTFSSQMLISRKEPPRPYVVRTKRKLPWLLLNMGEKYKNLVYNLLFLKLL